MQVAQEQQTTGQGVPTVVVAFGIGLAIILFGVVISRMGLLNGLRESETAVVSSTAIQLPTQDMRFGRQEIRLKVGQATTFLLNNRDFFDHSFDVDALNLHVAMPPNEETRFTFTPVQSGTYTLYCNVPGHREAGMVAMMIIEE